jgi:DNA polymerase I-like protein with 3'-5' exonuclease and polymerase domains
VDLEGKTGRKELSLDAYSGSYFKRNGIEYVFVNPLAQTVSVPYGQFLLNRFASKLSYPERWFPAPAFSWYILKERNIEQAYESFFNAFAIVVDIETWRDPLSIRCIGYTAIYWSDSKFTTESVVLPMDSVWALLWMRKFNLLPAPKILQNGRYDISYLALYNAPLHNYLWDTSNLFHSLYSELPKDLAFLQSFFVREAAYWKDLAETTDLEQYYLYNAKDTWATACAFLAWMVEAPEWARQNYLKEFPLQFPCHLSEMIGLKRDFSKLDKAREELDIIMQREQAWLNKITGSAYFNTNSPLQMKALLKVLGCGDLPNADEKALRKAAFRHPLNDLIVSKIVGLPDTDDLESAGIRGLRKRGAKEYKGRILYSLNPDKTDTGRLASKEHHFWCGLQVQNIPRGPIVKQTIIADNGFYFGEADLEQAETRDTAYITGDTKLIEAVSSPRDFHSINTAAFFGVPYESVYDDSKKKTINKNLRNLAKRVNHGANYNMGPDVLVDTMGLVKIFEARRLLKLPASWTAKQIAQYLLDQFGKTYPVVRNDYQKWVKYQVMTHKKLVGATGWTRYCFYDPEKDKRALNAYIAHNPQSLNAMVLNEAYMDVFYNIAIHPEHRNNFKLCAQIHDSILFQWREGHEYLADMVKKYMERPITIKDISGKTRIFTVPAAVKLGVADKEGKIIPAKYWSETE